MSSKMSHSLQLVASDSDSTEWHCPVCGRRLRLTRYATVVLQAGAPQHHYSDPPRLVPAGRVSGGDLPRPALAPPPGPGADLPLDLSAYAEWADSDDAPGESV